MLFEMQEIGLAIQVPWDYVTGKSQGRRNSDKGKPLSRRGLGWLVNPMGQALLDPLA